MTATLNTSNLWKVYGSGDQTVEAVRDVSLIAEAGEFIAIVGPSGSGKTSLLAMIGGLLTPTRGSIEVDGREIGALNSGARAAYRRSRVGYVFQSNNLLPFLTARENLLVMQAIGGRGDGRRADQLLDEMGLSTRARALATELSGGERQRVALARALMNDPDLVLVDEPTASLDSARGRQVVQLLRDEVKGRGKLAVMVTHDHDMAAWSDRVLVMHDGVLLPT
jgi:putative ABC transport system ATP-binding protein